MSWQHDRHNAQVQVLNEDVALVAYNVKEKLTVGGKPVNLDANDASVWIRKNGEWQCAMHTESLAGDPYGRDRKTREELNPHHQARNETGDRLRSVPGSY